MEMENIGAMATATDAFYIAPEKYTGDKRSSYGLELSITLSVHVPDQETYTPLETPMKNAIILTGFYSEFDIAASLDTMPNETMTTYTVRLIQ